MADTLLGDLPVTTSPLAKAPQALRLRVPIALILIYWTATIAVSSLDKLYFFSFLYNMISVGLLVLSYFTWWWLDRSISLAQRGLGFLVLVGVGALVEPLCHESVGWWGLFFLGPPVVLTAWTLWLMTAGRIAPKLRWPSALLVVVSGWALLTLVRFFVPDSSLIPAIAWRWQLSDEEKFLAERAASRESSQPVDTAWQPKPGPRDWPQFRGPQRDGVVRSAKINTDWKDSPPRLLWKKKLGPGWSSVIVVNGRLFTQEQIDDKECVVCYDAAIGTVIWTHEDSVRFKGPPAGVGPRSTPSFADGLICTLGATGILNGLDAVTGKRLWTRDITADAHAKVPQWGFSGSPLLVDGLAIVFAGGDADKGLLAYRLSDGSLAWTADAGTASYASPQLAKIAGQTQCLMLSDYGLTAFNPADGSPRWKTGTDSPKIPRSLMPHLVGDHQVLMGTLDGASVTLVEPPHAAGSADVKRLWTTDEVQPEFNDMVVHDGHAYGLNRNVFFCLDLSGGKLSWRNGRYGRGQVVLLADQALLLVISEKGEAVLLKANPDRHEVLGRFQALGETGDRNLTWNHPVVADNRLYVRNAAEIACYDLK